MSIQDIYNKVKKEVDTQPRKCEICGKIESMDDLILKYDNGKFMCDDCMFKYYKDETWEEEPASQEINDPQEIEIRLITEAINEFYGSDAMYYNVDSYGIAGHLYNAGFRKQSEGEWKRQKGRPEAICSECGCEVVYQVIDNKWAFENFCPHCGAKMKGGK